ncbi:uncharacterized protein [Phaseolus vulgaris]|uniref:uncharacterized protein n=1 Tax=Phaseolus vulgaris TaxID=3885 RepID=UPI0035CB905F
MAIPYVGNRYSGALSFGNKADEAPHGCHRVLHEVDQSRTSSTDHGPQGPALRVKKHSVPFRDLEESTTKETPFNLVYGSDAMIPVEIQENSPRFQNFVVEESNEEIKVNLDLLDEVREEAKIKVEALKRRVEYNYNSKLRPRQFQVANLVMRKAHPYQLENKLSPKWTGPFRITEAIGNGAYRLETLEGGTIPRTWNATNLKFYFS